MAKYFFILAILTAQFITAECSAQTTIKGTISNTSGEQLAWTGITPNR